MAAGLVLATKVAVVGALVAVGVVAAVIAPTVPVASAAPNVWVDAPAAGSGFPAEIVTVLAHATGPSVGGGDLIIDGRTNSRATSTTQIGTLEFLTFSWKATPGLHRVQVADGGLVSAPRDVLILGQVQTSSSPPVIIAPSSSHLTPTKTPTPTSSSPTTPSTTPATQPASSSSHHSSTPTPTHSTSTSPAKPTVSRPTMSGDVSWCGSGTITVTATGATAVSIQVSPGGPNLVATRVGSSDTWTATINASQLPSEDFDHRFTYSLVATAIGPGGTATSSAGTLTMDNCKP